MSILLPLVLLSSLSTLGNGDLPVGHMSRRSYGDWRATGAAFANGPISSQGARQLGIDNGVGPVVTSKLLGDGPIGILTSPVFRIGRKYIAFRISGGRYERDNCLNLVVHGKIVRSATGWNNDRLMPQSWDVSRWRGQEAQIQVVDRASGDWGHINVDRIVQTDNPEQPPFVTEPLYRETLRPQFHFSARQWTISHLNPREREEGWINDLNGLIYYDGEYHLFAQRWNKCWLHAVSRDLVHWTELEPAFWEEELESGCQSGTCVVDYQNTSGLAADKAHPAMIAFWSGADNRRQCISYSLDHGRTWKHYEKNPIMIYPERDPKVFWYAPGKHWVMVMYGDGQYHIFTSPNLLDWKDEHHPIPDSFECPDFFELPLDGDPAKKKWVLIQGNGNYSIGNFDGMEFKEETPRFACDVGPNFYATQSWANVETGDGRRVQAAWMRGSNFPEMPFNQQISFPCELTLRTTPNGPRIFREPIKEIASLHHREDSWSNFTLGKDQSLPLEPAGRLYHIKAEVSIPEGARLTFNVRGVPVVLTHDSLSNGTDPARSQGEIKSIELLIDRTSIEAFANRGEISSTRFVLPRETGISVHAEGGDVLIRSLSVYALNSAWPNGDSN
jgi:sucrose-6-phosphate hydrolase SacC (GH32 family)